MSERKFNVITPLQFFFKKVVNGSVLLFLATTVAMVIANSSISDWYNNLLSHPINFQIGSLSLFSHHGQNLTLIQFVNDALMAVFFFLIGLEIKREILVGELSSMKKATLPIIAALGGMIIPVLVFYLICNEAPASHGIAIPIATDIAFALGVLALLGKRVPLGMKVFLTALAVVDDIGGILVIALFYGGEIGIEPLLISAVLLAVTYAGGKIGIANKYFYYILAFIIWMMFLESGLHPTIAGVLVGLTIPARPKFDTKLFLQNMRDTLETFPEEGKLSSKRATVLTHKQIYTLKHMETMARKTISPLQEIADDLEPLVHYFVLPLFAFVNAGITFDNLTFSLVGVPVAIFSGLFIGKAVGIFCFSYVFLKSGLVNIPTGMNYKNLFAVSILGGIGFTVSLFIANLSYADIPEVGVSLLNEAKIGVFAGSLVSGLVGYFLLNKTLPAASTEEIESKN